MLNKITHYLRTGKLAKKNRAGDKRGEYKCVLFRAWELHFLVKAAQERLSYECSEYEPEEEKAILRLIAKLERNAESQTKKEQEADHA
jgi:hypothetical protein